jgi:anti-sigma factor RsiW
VSGPEIPSEEDFQAFIDGRLDDARQALVKTYLASNPAVARRISDDRATRDALRRALGSLDPVLPLRLRIGNIRATRMRRIVRYWQAGGVAAAIFLIGIGGGFGIARSGLIPAPTPCAMTAVTQDASLAYRTYASEIMHPVEVDAAHETHMQGWLSNRVGRTLTIPDLTKFGYRLLGGRVLPASPRAAAQLMYVNAAAQRLAVYVQTSNAPDQTFHHAGGEQTSTTAWIEDGFGYAITAPDGEPDLDPIVRYVCDTIDQ